MQLTALVRNSHPLHFDELYCKDNSFTKQRVVYGGLVLAWVATLASRDLAGRAVWELGSTPAPIPTASSAATRSTRRRRCSPSRTSTPTSRGSRSGSSA